MNIFTCAFTEKTNSENVTLTSFSIKMSVVTQDTPIFLVGKGITFLQGGGNSWCILDPIDWAQLSWLLGFCIS